jgi:glycerophosphoryl diester phosphodiesterase
LKVFGHRGSPGFPRFGENTLTSFRKALAAGADGFELDVRRCADGTIVVIHDARIDRTTNGTGFVRNMTYPSLSHFDAGYGDVIPRLSDVFDEFGSRCAINVELKEDDLAQEVTSMCRERALSKVVLSAFDSDDSDKSASSSWTDLAPVAADIETALLVSSYKLRRIGPASLMESALRIGARGIHPAREAVTTEVVTLAHAASLSVRVWTVNHASEAQRLREIGVDALFSDYPDRCLKP